MQYSLWELGSVVHKSTVIWKVCSGMKRKFSENRKNFYINTKLQALQIVSHYVLLPGCISSAKLNKCSVGHRLQ